MKENEITCGSENLALFCCVRAASDGSSGGIRLGRKFDLISALPGTGTTLFTECFIDKILTSGRLSSLEQA
jgi:hypothetical protein